MQPIKYISLATLADLINEFVSPQKHKMCSNAELITSSCMCIFVWYHGGPLRQARKVQDNIFLRHTLDVQQTSRPRCCLGMCSPMRNTMRKDLVTDNFKVRHYIYASETDPFRMKGVGFIDTWQKAKFARAPRRTNPGPMAAAVAQGGAGGPPLKLHKFKDISNGAR